MTVPRRNSARKAPFSVGHRLRSWRGKNAILSFSLSFAVLMVAYYAVVEVPFFDQLLARLLQWNAAASGALLNLLGQHTHTTGTVINSIRFSTNVRRGCDAVEPAWFFDAAVLAFPAPWSRRWVAIAAGTVLIGVLNVVRVASLFLVGVYCPRAFEMAHLEVWPAAFILFAAGLWVTWLVWLRRAPAHARP